VDVHSWASRSQWMGLISEHLWWNTSPEQQLLEIAWYHNGTVEQSPPTTIPSICLLLIGSDLRSRFLLLLFCLLVWLLSVVNQNPFPSPVYLFDHCCQSKPFSVIVGQSPPGLVSYSPLVVVAVVDQNPFLLSVARVLLLLLESSCYLMPLTYVVQYPPIWSL